MHHVQQLSTCLVNVYARPEPDGSLCMCAYPVAGACFQASSLGCKGTHDAPVPPPRFDYVARAAMSKFLNCRHALELDMDYGTGLKPVPPAPVCSQPALGRGHSRRAHMRLADKGSNGTLTSSAGGAGGCQECNRPGYCMLLLLHIVGAYACMMINTPAPFRLP